MKSVVFYSINDGLFFWNGHHGILVDYLFDNRVTAWSDLPDATHRRMLGHSGEFSREHTMLFTHSHPDHYSRKYVQEYVKLYSSGVYGPGIPESNLIPEGLSQGDAALDLPGWRVIFLQTEHQGTGSSLKVKNTALCLESESCWYLHLGDSVLNEALTAKLGQYGIGPLEAVFANYYHIVPEEQRAYLRHFQAKHTFAIHFPFAENDEYHIKQRLARFLANASDPFLKEIIVPKPMGRIL